jgi:hypothetical protein
LVLVLASVNSRGLELEELVVLEREAVVVLELEEQGSSSMSIH